MYIVHISQPVLLLQEYEAVQLEVKEMVGKVLYFTNKHRACLIDVHDSSENYHDEIQTFIDEIKGEKNKLILHTLVCVHTDCLQFICS